MSIEEHTKKVDEEKHQEELVKVQESISPQHTAAEPPVKNFIPKAPFPQRLAAPKKGAYQYSVFRCYSTSALSCKVFKRHIVRFLRER